MMILAHLKNEYQHLDYKKYKNEKINKISF